MFEATLEQGDVFKKIIGAIGDLVQDANFECDAEGMRLQAMDSSHVSLVSLWLAKDAFSNFQCDKPCSLGINFASLAKVLKLSKANDSLTLRMENEKSDTVALIFTDQGKVLNLVFWCQFICLVAFVAIVVLR